MASEAPKWLPELPNGFRSSQIDSQPPKGFKNRPRTYYGPDCKGFFAFRKIERFLANNAQLIGFGFDQIGSTVSTDLEKTELIFEVQFCSIFGSFLWTIGVRGPILGGLVGVARAENRAVSGANNPQNKIRVFSESFIRVLAIEKNRSHSGLHFCEL